MRSLGSETALPRRDPAPSRWSYRLNRMWLTPGYRRLLRLGVPACLIAAAALWFVSDDSRVQAYGERFQELVRTIEERPEFMVNMMSVDGASPELAEAIRAELPIRFPVSSFDLDLDAMRLKVEGFNAVESAHIRIRPGGTLVVEVAERQPVVVWRHASGLTLLDRTGHVVAGTGLRSDWPDLPLIAGQGAERVVSEALEIFAAADPFQDRVRGLVRMGERRWDVVLDRNQRIQLPEQGPVATVERIIALDTARKMLERDISVADFRNPGRPTLRLNADAYNELYNINDEAPGGASE
ncbi:cell division protein FtsQ/DivIB [Tropicimonas sp.]|uniref:cell division protein FtsQ/DivIB n=1 Tax=Tropicimonas sp. TaxID=2067044 RepID=UPI003A8B7A73